MAIKTTTVLVDDIDGTEIPHGAGETVRFGLDGIEYEIDLSDGNAADLRERFGDYISRARKSGRAPKRTAARGASVASSGKSNTSAIREWARNQGREIGDRGRIPAEIVDAYQAAH